MHLKIDLSKIELPSNKKFGFFFSALFCIIALYFWYQSYTILLYAFIFLSSILFFITLIKVDFLLPLNKLWMRFGLVLGIIISPIVLGIIFFGVFTPIAFLMRLNRRDELRLKFKSKSSHWISRKEALPAESFENQF